MAVVFRAISTNGVLTPTITMGAASQLQPSNSVK